MIKDFEKLTSRWRIVTCASNSSVCLCKYNRRHYHPYHGRDRQVVMICSISHLCSSRPNWRMNLFEQLHLNLKLIWVSMVALFIAVKSMSMSKNVILKSQSKNNQTSWLRSSRWFRSFIKKNQFRPKEAHERHHRSDFDTARTRIALHLSLILQAQKTLSNFIKSTSISTIRPCGSRRANTSCTDALIRMSKKSQLIMINKTESA